jgi:hypothetical protein
MTKRDDEEINRYFQAVSRFFLEHRGAPFFLTSKEVEYIKDWKNRGIPLQIVREGIEDCFANHRRRPGRRGKIFSLAFCNTFVLRGYDAHKERKVGRQSRLSQREDKRMVLKKAVDRFLASCPDDFSEVRNIYERALKQIFEDQDEHFLEDLELEVDALVAEMASDEERRMICDEVQAEFRDKSKDELERIQSLKLVKYIREKYAIPHLPLYYY